ncbi:MAG TPA: hypothetical protein VGH38_21785 [Bryobacteraceae bacterium]|jgi:hypothetical protein
MPISRLDRLEAWKRRFGSGDTARLERLLAAASKWRLRDAAGLIRLHETVLFLRSWPASPEIARLADGILFSFARRVADLPEDERAAFAEPEISGIAGSSLTAVFSHDVARSLAARYPRNVEIAWDCYDEPDRLGPLLTRLLPMMAEDYPVEAHPPYREWLPAGGLAWLLDHSDYQSYDALQLPLTWNIANAPTSRSRLRLPNRKLYCHPEPLLRRSDISLDTELKGPPMPVKRLLRPEARKILDIILDTSAMRYRELYGFSHPDETGVFHADAGRGVSIYFFGVPPSWRLPLRAYHAGMFFKNGVPAGYVELLSFFDRAETGFNLYYTFRDGETAWLYARLLRLFHQVLGVNTFSVDPYQIGLENSEAVDSGAFWFYRKLGFRPVDPEIATLTEREEHRMRQTPGYRSSRRTLEKLAVGYMVYEGPSAERGLWDHFRIRRLAMAVQRGNRASAGKSSSGLAMAMNSIPDLRTWNEDERTAAARILHAKEKGSEARYLRLMQQHRRLRDAFLAMGSEA